jgi:hypothetical protein
MDDFSYVSFGRSRKTLMVLISIYAALVFMIMHFDAALWVMGIVAGFTLPALWDLWANRTAGLTLSRETLNWHSGNRGSDIPLSDIKKVRLDTRLDLSVRATIIPHQGRKIRLPYEATPPHRALETALTARNIKTERHHFNLFS